MKKVIKAVKVRTDGQRASFVPFHDSEWEVIYKKGEKAYPPEYCPGSKLMAFATLEDAEIHAAVEEWDCEIWLAETTRAECIFEVSNIYYGAEAFDFWKLYPNYWGRIKYLYEAPKGSLACDDITLIERIGYVYDREFFFDNEFDNNLLQS